MEVQIGTKIKLNLHIDKYAGLSMSEYDFNAEIYTPRGKQKIAYRKEDMIMIDDDNYCILIDTAIIGLGRIKIKVSALFPDDDFSDNIREEIEVIDTGIIITNE